MVDNGHIFCIICMYVLILYQTDCRYGVIITRHLKKPGCDAQGVPATLQIHTHTHKSIGIVHAFRTWVTCYRVASEVARQDRKKACMGGATAQVTFSNMAFFFFFWCVFVCLPCADGPLL
jgi:hypothetical protein